MADRLILYVGEKNVSSWSMRAYVAMVAKGIAFEERPIRLVEDRDRARRMEIGPTGLVPVLHHLRDGEEPLIVPDSLAIIEYLEETFPPPAHPALWPSDRRRRAQARGLAAAMHSGFSSLRESMSFNLCFLPRRPAATPEALEEAGEMLGYFEAALRAKTEPGPFLFGTFGAADVVYAPAVWRLKAFAVPTTKAPRAASYVDAVLDHPAVRRWMDPARALPPVERE